MLIVAGPVGEHAHDGGPHPERPARVTAVMEGIADLHLGSDLRIVDPRPATRADLERVHGGQYLDDLEAFSRRGGGDLDPDTYVTPTSWETACKAAGAGLVAIEELRGAGDGVAFAVARPPGHHAEPARGMGFCLLNNIAVAAASLVAEGERVLIVDWDVHHGNGTQETFWEEPRVLYTSTHQWPLYPGTGRPSDVGAGEAVGTTLNVPVPAGATGDVLQLAFDEAIVPAAEAFAPDWVLVSCGFDAHRADPLAELALSSADFGALAQTASALTRVRGRVVLFLEGGYDAMAVRHSAAATVGALVGAGTGPVARTFGGPGADAVRAGTEMRRRAVDRALEVRLAGGMDAPVTGSPPSGRAGW